MPAAGDRCEVCGAALVVRSSGPGRSGRPARYCSAACRQRAYRQRSAAPTAPSDPRPSDPAPAAPAQPSAPPSPAPAPPAAVAVARRPVLPAPLDRFVGRSGDLAQLETLRERYRLITLLGPG